MTLDHFMVISQHTKENCLRALDEIAEQEPELLDKTWFGCGAGDHTGWTLFEAENEQEACSMLPRSLRADARVVPVAKMTPEQIRSFHLQKAA